MIITTLSFILVLGILVFVHEFGHFITARLCGVGVEVFSFGFGPRLFGRRAGRTDYRVSIVPLGGYVKMVGEDPDAGIAPEDMPESFSHKSVGRRILIVLAGPAFNFFLAILIFFVMFRMGGMEILRAEVGTVMENSPAMAAGIRKGDTVIRVNEAEVGSWEEMAALIGDSGGRELRLTLRRGEEFPEVRLLPEKKESRNLFGESVDRYIIGITPSGAKDHHPLCTLDAAAHAIERTAAMTWLTVVSAGKMIQGRISVKENLGGPISIARMSGEMVRRGPSEFSFYIAFLSISLGIINLFPIPVLDGGHLLFFGLEVILRRPVDIAIREKALQAGFFALMLLMVFALYNDIARIFGGPS
ncbi:MAG: RIP metalloprotease RseP [Desulfobacterales bacterium]|nr:MAG: RIP metalloprotease RseP [Desulfobacterales bacterium]